jgi:hypothetical protein
VSVSMFPGGSGFLSARPLAPSASVWEALLTGHREPGGGRWPAGQLLGHPHKVDTLSGAGGEARYYQATMGCTSQPEISEQTVA